MLSAVVGLDCVYQVCTVPNGLVLEHYNIRVVAAVWSRSFLWGRFVVDVSTSCTYMHGFQIRASKTVES